VAMPMENARIKNKNAINGMEVRNAYIFFIGKVSINGLKIVHFGNMAKKELLKREQKVFYLKFAVYFRLNSCIFIHR
jgi:hypothetical protein